MYHFHSGMFWNSLFQFRRGKEHEKFSSLRALPGFDFGDDRSLSAAEHLAHRNPFNIILCERPISGPRD
jgi:hypothetical protein